MPTPTSTCLCFSPSIQASKQRKLHFLQWLRCKVRTGCELTLPASDMLAVCAVLVLCSSRSPSPLLRAGICLQASLLHICAHNLTASFLTLLPAHPPAFPLNPEIPPNPGLPTPHPLSQSCLTSRNPMGSHTAHSRMAWSRFSVLPVTSCKWTCLK